jgi:hypothetical protein
MMKEAKEGVYITIILDLKELSAYLGESRQGDQVRRLFKSG